MNARAEIDPVDVEGRIQLRRGQRLHGVAQLDVMRPRLDRPRVRQRRAIDVHLHRVHRRDARAQHAGAIERDVSVVDRGERLPAALGRKVEAQVVQEMQRERPGLEVQPRLQARPRRAAEFCRAFMRTFEVLVRVIARGPACRRNHRDRRDLHHEQGQRADRDALGTTGRRGPGRERDGDGGAGGDPERRQGNACAVRRHAPARGRRQRAGRLSPNAPTEIAAAMTCA